MQPYNIQRQGLCCLALLLVVVLAAMPYAMPTQATQQRPRTATPSLFGMNMYITGRERSDAQAIALVQQAQSIGIAWSREEISWASWGKEPHNDFYDARISLLADAGIHIIGMLLTTPSDYRTQACKDYAAAQGQPKYWCAPSDPQAYAAWATTVIERYDADGIDDAPGSPRIDAWEIWNEPDMDGTWLPQADPVAYAAILRAGYNAIKAADPTALVLSGGVMVFDAVGEKGFMDQVVAHAGWDSFDVLSIHPWLLDHAPDEPTLINPREGYDITIPGRLALVQRWIDAHGGGKPIWITEVGWSTCGERCEPQFAKSEEQQANYMVRTYILAAAAGVQHVSYFQLEDKFEGDHVPWSQAAIVRDDGQPKPAFTAYGTMVAQVQHAQFHAPGPLHQPGVLADYRFALPDGGSVAVLWSVHGEHTIEVALEPGQKATLTHGDGRVESLTGDTAHIVVGESPLYVRQVVERAHTFAETGYTLQGRFLSFWEQHGDMPILGLPISPEREERGADGTTYTVQWLERARLELHPQHAPPNDVLVGLLGVDTLAMQGTDWRALPTVAATDVPDECRFFAETGHSLCPPFLAFWQHHGGLPVFGYPISQPFTEVNAADGQPYTVQYFERNRFEHHPELAPPNDVLLGLLGVELMPR